MRLAPLGFLASAAVAAGPPLDPYSANLWAAYSLTRLLTSYTGALIRVRRSSDNAEQDIGYSGLALDTAALATFVGANSAFVKTFYDQSGGTHDLAQTTSGKQPRIVNAGTYDGKLVFDQSDDSMLTGNTSGTNTAFHMFMKGQIRSQGSVRVICEQKIPVTYPGALLFTNFDAGAGGNMLQAVTGQDPTGADREQTSASASSNFAGGGVLDVLWDRTQSPSSAAIKFAFNGSVLSAATPTPGPNTTAFSPTTFEAVPWYLASRGDSSLFSDLDCVTWVIYEASKATDRAAIAAALA